MKIHVLRYWYINQGYDIQQGLIRSKALCDATLRPRIPETAMRCNAALGIIECVSLMRIFDDDDDDDDDDIIET